VLKGAQLHTWGRLFVFVPIFSEFFLTLVGGDFSEFAFSSTGHFKAPFRE
jgi:hypothetical protein